jgi:hypothetical protein
MSSTIIFPLQRHINELHSVEAKWLVNQLNYESYERWFKELSAQKKALKAQLEGLAGNDQEICFQSLTKTNWF